MVAINSSRGNGATSAPDSQVVSVPQPRITLVRRALRERRALRRALRQAQASQVVLSRRWVAAAAASSSYCSKERLQLEGLRRSLIARVQAAKASAGREEAAAAAAAAAAAEGAASTNVESYFAALLAQRGRSPAGRTSLEAGYLKQPTPKQVEDYQQRPFVSDLARKGDIAGLQKAVEAGRGMVSHTNTHHSSSHQR